MRNSTFRFGASVGLIVVLLASYIGHTYAAQELLDSLAAERSEGVELRAELAMLRGRIAEAMAPRIIYQRAAQLGLEEGGSYAGTIYVGQEP